VVWNDTPEPNRTVCAYVSVDSATANRLYFAAPRGTITIPSSEIGAAGNNLVPLLPADEALPSTRNTALSLKTRSVQARIWGRAEALCHQAKYLCNQEILLNRAHNLAGALVRRGKLNIQNKLAPLRYPDKSDV
jgi:hypothetical protein